MCASGKSRVISGGRSLKLVFWCTFSKYFYQTDSDAVICFLCSWPLPQTFELLLPREEEVFARLFWENRTASEFLRNDFVLLYDGSDCNYYFASNCITGCRWQRTARVIIRRAEFYNASSRAPVISSAVYSAEKLLRKWRRAAVLMGDVTNKVTTRWKC